MKTSKLLVVLTFALIALNLAFSGVLVARSINSAKQRTSIQTTVDRFECILYIQPSERTPATANERCGVKQ